MRHPTQQGTSRPCVRTLAGPAWALAWAAGVAPCKQQAARAGQQAQLECQPASYIACPTCPARAQNLKGKQHFTSLHGKVGLCAFSLALAAPLLGAAAFRRLGLIQRFPEAWQPRLKWLHRLVSARPAVGMGGWVEAGGGGCRGASL